MSTKARLAAAFLLLSCGGVLALLAQSPSVTIAYMGVFGGHVQDEGDAIAIDGNGGVYITGYTQSFDFPVTPGAVLTTPNLLGSSFVTKLNANTGGIVYSTFLNGKAGGIGVDTSGSTYVIASIYKTPHVGLADGIEVTKLSPGGNAIVYQTSLPGPSLGNGIAVGTDGSVYITGATAAANFPVTPGAVQTKLHGTDAFLAKLDPAGRLMYATYLGGSGDEEGQAIAVDSAGNAYITGVVHNGTDFPVVNATQPNPGGGIRLSQRRWRRYVGRSRQGDFFGGRFDGCGPFQWIGRIRRPAHRRPLQKP